MNETYTVTKIHDLINWTVALTKRGYVVTSSGETGTTTFKKDNEYVTIILNLEKEC